MYFIFIEKTSELHEYVKLLLRTDTSLTVLGLGLHIFKKKHKESSNMASL